MNKRFPCPHVTDSGQLMWTTRELWFPDGAPTMKEQPPSDDVAVVDEASYWRDLWTRTANGLLSAQGDVEALKHDIERHLKICSELATENEQLISYNCEIRGEILALRAYIDEYCRDANKYVAERDALWVEKESALQCAHIAKVENERLKDDLRIQDDANDILTRDNAELRAELRDTTWQDHADHWKKEAERLQYLVRHHEEFRKESERLRAELEAVKTWYGLEHEAARKRGTRPAEETPAAQRWRYASFENPPHEHEWTDHAHCILCGVRYDSLPGEGDE